MVVSTAVFFVLLLSLFIFLSYFFCGRLLQMKHVQFLLCLQHLRRSYTCEWRRGLSGRTNAWMEKRAQNLFVHRSVDQQCFPLVDSFERGSGKLRANWILPRVFHSPPLILSSFSLSLALSLYTSLPTAIPLPIPLLIPDPLPSFQHFHSHHIFISVTISVSFSRILCHRSTASTTITTARHSHKTLLPRKPPDAIPPKPASFEFHSRND